MRLPCYVRGVSGSVAESRLHAPLFRGGLAVVLLLWLAGPYWPGTVDDVYISVGFARQWAETGALTWTDGVRVEGYSNFLMVALLAAGMKLGADGGLWAQWVALLSAIGVLGALSRWLPRTPAGTLALLGVAAWASFCRWSVIGMETTLYALLLASGWVGVLRGGRAWGAGTALLALASLTRLEGAGHLVLGLLLRARGARARQPGDGLAAAALAGLVGYHALRVGWYGHFWPTPALVKIGGVPWTGHGLLQGGADLLTAAGVLGAAWAATRPRGRALALALAPLALQLLVLARASGDWMAHGRLVLPGVVAAVAGMTAVAGPAVRLGRVGLVVLVVAVGVGAGVESRGYGTVAFHHRDASAALRSPAAWTRGLDTPVAEDVVYAANHLQADQEFLAVDAGMLGSIPQSRLLDMRGLVNRPIAAAIARGGAQRALVDVLESREVPPRLRVASWVSGPFPPLPSWLSASYVDFDQVRYRAGVVRWFPLTSHPVEAQVRTARWSTLVRRFSSQPFVHWHAALAFRDIGADAEADSILESARKRWPRDVRFQRPDLCGSFTRSTGPIGCDPQRGVPLLSETRLGSRPLAETMMMEVTLRCGDPASPMSVEVRVAGTDCKGRDSILLSCEETFTLRGGLCGPDTRLWMHVPENQDEVEAWASVSFRGL